MDGSHPENNTKMSRKGDSVNRDNGSDDFDNDGHWSST